MKYTFFLVSVLLTFFGCDKPQQTTSAASNSGSAQTPPKGPTTLTVYSGRGAVLVEPLFERFTKQTGIVVKARFDKSTGALAERIVTEGKQCPADVFFAQDSGYLGALAKRELLLPLPKALAGKVDEAFRPKSGRWLPISGRARVLVYNPEVLTPDKLPSRLEQLAEPAWKGRIGWAPSNASLQAHVSALRHLWGEEQTKAWLEKLKANEPKVYPKNSPQVKAVSNKEIQVGWVNHYYLHKLKASNPKLKAANHSFEAGNAGNVMMLSGVAVLASAPHAEAANRFVSFLLSDETQKYFAQNVYEYPVRASIERHPDVPALSNDLVRVKQAHLADVSKTVAMLRTLGLN